MGLTREFVQGEVNIPFSGIVYFCCGLSARLIVSDRSSGIHNTVVFIVNKEYSTINLRFFICKYSRKFKIH